MPLARVFTHLPTFLRLLPFDLPPQLVCNSNLTADAVEVSKRALTRAELLERAILEERHFVPGPTFPANFDRPTVHHPPTLPMFPVGDDDSDDDMNDEVVNAEGEIHAIPLTRKMLRVRAREKIDRDEVERDRLAIQVRGGRWTRIPTRS